MTDILVIPARYNGPPGSANGGYFAGRVAQLVAADVATVTLRQPPPLETPLDVVGEDGGLRIVAGDELVAEAVSGALTSPLVAPVTFDEAAKTAPRYGGLVEHPFPTCFSCGIARTDGLGLRPGPLTDHAGVTAASWTPDRSLTVDGAIPAAVVWAALDCPGGWTVDLVGRPMVLGRMTAQVAASPVPGERCVIMGRLDGRDGRKIYTTTTAYGRDERLLGRAQATWIELHKASPVPPTR